MGVIDGSDHHNNTGCSGQLGNFLVHSHAQEEHSFNFAHNLEMHFCAQGVHYSRTCFLRSPLGPAKASLKQQVVCETRVTETFHANSTLFFSSNSKWKYTLIFYIFICCSKFTQKVVPSLHNPATRDMCALLWSHTQVHVHADGSVHAKSSWWSLVIRQVVAPHRDFSVQNHPCTEFHS